MVNGEKWTLPVVYVPFWERRNLIEVLYEVAEVKDVTVVFLWFHWSHDLPASTEPEYEPVAIAFVKGWPKLVFYRPHNECELKRPVLHGRSAVVYVSMLGHAPVVSRRRIMLYSLLPIYRRLSKKTLEAMLTPGTPPERFLVWRGVNFREWVIETLKRPETNKYLKGNGMDGVLRYFLHMLMVCRYAGKGDLRKVYRHLLKAYLSLPTPMKLNPYLLYLLDYAGGARRMTNNNESLSEENRKYLRIKFLGILLTTPIFFFDRPKKEELEEAVENLRYTVDQLKNT